MDVAHASIDLVNRDSGASALAYAALESHPAIVEDLVARGANVHGAPSHQPFTPLWCAAMKGHLDVVVVLLKHGAAADDCGERALLHGGALGGHVRVVAYALDCAHAAARGPREGASTIKYVAARYAAYHGHEEVVSLDSHPTNHPAPVATAVVGPYVYGSFTPIHMAARHGHVGVVRFLLKHAASGAVQPGHVGNTALYLAAHHDHVDVVRELCAARHRPPDDDDDAWRSTGPRVTAWLARTHGYSSFEFACDRGDVEAVRAFLRAPDAVDAAAIAVAASRTDTYRNGPAVAALLRDALAPWCPRVHAVRPASFRVAIVPVLLACRRRGIPRDVALSHVLASCGRDWWWPSGEEPDGNGDGGEANGREEQQRDNFCWGSWAFLLGGVCGILYYLFAGVPERFDTMVE